jgi:hypothetical protein
MAVLTEMPEPCCRQWVNLIGWCFHVKTFLHHTTKFYAIKLKKQLHINMGGAGKGRPVFVDAHGL